MDKYNCPNCGAVITGSVCEYCGTVFNADKAFNKIKKDGYFVELNLDGEAIKAYINNAQVTHNKIWATAGRDLSGRLQMSEPIIKRKIELELIEV